MRIRPASMADFPAMHRIRLAVRENRLSDPGRIGPGDYRAILEGGGRGWIAESGGDVLGFAVGDLDRRNVWALFVDPEAEGRGVGRTLHDTMMRWFFDQGVSDVWLGTDPGTRAEAFYRRAGWLAAGPGEDGEVRYEMTRDRWEKGRQPE